MPVNLKIATFNMENLDDKPGQQPTLAERIIVIRHQLIRLNTDILCLQEINGQEAEEQPRRLLALEKLIEGTPYANYHKISTMTGGGTQVYDKRNLVTLSRHEIMEHRQSRHDFAPAPIYREVTAEPPEEDATEITWERPILYTKIDLQGSRILHVINLHLKSRLPSVIRGQQIDRYTWKTASGWAEGFFISSMKRVGQALETRVFIDKLFDENEEALIVVCGDFNAESDEVPLDAIRGEVENTGNSMLASRVMIPCEQTIPKSSRYSFLHHGKGRMIDHLMVSRALLAYYKSAEIHNEILHDESVRFSDDKMFPESDHAPILAVFELPEN